MKNVGNERERPRTMLDREIENIARDSAMRIWLSVFQSVPDTDVVRSLAKGLKLLVDSNQVYQALDFLEGMYALTDEVFPERVYDYARSCVTLRKFFAEFEAKTGDVLLAMDLAEYEVLVEELTDE